MSISWLRECCEHIPLPWCQEHSQALVEYARAVARRFLWQQGMTPATHLRKWYLVALLHTLAVFSTYVFERQQARYWPGWDLPEEAEFRQCWIKLVTFELPSFELNTVRQRRLGQSQVWAHRVRHARSDDWDRVVEKRFEWHYRWHFIREALCLQRLHRSPAPHTIPWLGVRVHEQTCSLFLPRARHSLFEAMQSPARFDEAQCWLWMLQVVRAVRHAHACGVAHRDIKPDNILVADLGWNLWLADWDAAVHVQEPCQLSALANPVCTYSYGAPEVWEGKYDPFQLDVWSLGMVALWLFAGYQIKNEAVKARKVMSNLARTPATELLSRPRFQHLDAGCRGRLECWIDACLRWAKERCSIQQAEEIVQALYHDGR